MPDTTHECPADNCTRRVPRSQLACREHWFKVSADTRRAVNATWSSGDLEAYVEVRADAVAEMNQ